MNEPNIPETNVPKGQMLAHYKDRLSLLVRIDALENTDAVASEPFPRKRNKGTRAAKSHKGKNLITTLKKRLQALDKN